MDADLLFLARIIDNESQRLKSAAAKERSGRGHTLIALLEETCARIASEAGQIAAQLPLSNSAFGPSLERELFRLRYELQFVHELLARYGGDSGRRDLPVGIAHLVDELVRDFLPRRADPIIHLTSENMYSTLAIVDTTPQLWREPLPPEPHPVAFNLPALDPSNVMFSPILAHEVGHTAWRKGLEKELNRRADLGTASTHLRTAASATGIDAQRLVEFFDSWRQELLCDALAAVLTGPSFLFASAVFLPATASTTSIGAHPYPRDRIAYCLRILDRRGWTPFMKEQIPNIYEWCRSLGNSVALSGGPIETGLRAAIGATEPAITEVALDKTSNGIDVLAFSAKLPEFREWFSNEVPPVKLSTSVPTPWEIVAAAWICELNRLGDTAEALVMTSSNVYLNRFLLKSIELAGIHQLWSET